MANSQDGRDGPAPVDDSPGAAVPSRLAGALARAGVALIEVDRERRITLFNHGAEQLFGYPREEALGQHVAALLPDLEGEPAAWRTQTTGVRRDATTFSAAVEASPIPPSGGALLVVASASAGLALPAPGDASAPDALLDVVQDAVIVTDMELRITRWNPAAEALYGWSAAEVLHKPASEMLRSEYLDGERAQLLAQLFDRGVWRGEVIHHHRDGRAIVILATTTVVRDAAGAPAGIISVNRDVSERKLAEQGLRRSSDRLRVLSEASRAFAEVGLDYQPLLELVTRRMVETLGDFCLIRMLSDDGQWLPLAAMHYYDPDDHESVAFIQNIVARAPLRVDEPNIDQQVFQSGEPLLVPTVDLARLKATIKPEFVAGIERFLPRSMLIVPLRLHGQSIGLLGAYRSRHQWPAFTQDDLTLAQELADRAALAIGNARLFLQAQAELAERQRAEQALEAERELLARRVAERTADLSLANAELARAARLKDEFLANMSHELRTPLNAILGRSEAIEEEIYGPVTTQQVAAVHGIIESSQHLLTLINDILDLSKIESGRLTLDRALLDVNLVGTMALRMVAQIAQLKRIALSSQFDVQVQQLSADERRLKQILVNLLSNAVKFTPEGGRVGLEVRGSREEQTVTFTVWDTGIGIAAEDLPRLFQPFVQLDSSLNREYVGTGLGLSLVARLTQAHGGSVAVTSTPGQGSRFSVTLPWPPDDQNTGRSVTSAAVDRTPPLFGTALVVEDSATAAAQVTRYLRELGARVEVHAHGTGAVDRALAVQPDVIILDILLPDADGWDVLRQLKAEPRTQAIPVVVISVVDEPALAHTLGAAALLAKPIDRAGLVQILRAVTGRRSEQPVETSLVVSPSAQRPHILLADDNEATIETVSDYLHAKGYEVSVARNGHEAIARAQEEQPELILMDIQMPGMDGLEAIRRLRAEPGTASIPILAVTALAMPGDRERCLAAGANDYLAKPISFRTLVATIEQHRRRVAEQPEG